MKNYLKFTNLKDWANFNNLTLEEVYEPHIGEIYYNTKTGHIIVTNKHTGEIIRDTANNFEIQI